MQQVAFQSINKPDNRQSNNPHQQHNYDEQWQGQQTKRNQLDPSASRLNLGNQQYRPQPQQQIQDIYQLSNLQQSRIYDQNQRTSPYKSGQKQPKQEIQLKQYTLSDTKYVQQGLQQQNSLQNMKISQLPQQELQKKNEPTYQNQQYLYVQFNKLQDSNLILQQKLQQVELKQNKVGESYSDNLLQKIKMLIKENGKLLENNIQIEQQLQAHSVNIVENRKFLQLQQQNENLEININYYNDDIQVWSKRYDELKENMQQLESKTGSQRKEYQVIGIEQKIQQLIQENEQLNNHLCEKINNLENVNINHCNTNLQLIQEKEKLQNTFKIYNQESQIWRSKYIEVEKKLAQFLGDEKHNQFYITKIDSLESKIQLLIGENDKLNSIINEKLNGNDHISELEEKINNLKIQNYQLDINIDQWKKKCEYTKQEISNIQKKSKNSSQITAFDDVKE